MRRCANSSNHITCRGLGDALRPQSGARGAKPARIHAVPSAKQSGARGAKPAPYDAIQQQYGIMAEICHERGSHMFHNTLATLNNQVSGAGAKNLVARISQWHRIQASPMYREAAEW